MSDFSAISTTSGASWFSTQLFYSPQFYESVVDANDTQSLYDFVVVWMQSYTQMLTDSIENSPISPELGMEVCDFTNVTLANNTDAEGVSELCNTLLYFDGDWAQFTNDMLDYAARSYGDLDFTNKVAGSENRIDALKGTDLLIQNALVANSRVRSSDDSDIDTAVYIGTEEGGSVYAVPLSHAYVVDDSGTSHRYSSYGYGDLSVSTAETSPDHSFSDWEDFHLYPGLNGTVLIDKEGVGSVDGGKLKPEFGGDDATVTQVSEVGFNLMPLFMSQLLLLANPLISA